MVKINNFQSDLSDISATTATPVRTNDFVIQIKLKLSRNFDPTSIRLS